MEIAPSAPRAQTPEPFPPQASPPIQRDVLFTNCLGNAAFARSLVAEWQASGWQQAAAIVAHAGRGEHGAAAEIAHSLKGAAGILGADVLRAKAADVELAARHGNCSLLPGLAHDLQREMDRCLNYIPTLQL